MPVGWLLPVQSGCRQRLYPPHLGLGALLCSRKHIARGRRARYVLRTLDSEVQPHPGCDVSPRILCHAVGSVASLQEDDAQP